MSVRPHCPAPAAPSRRFGRGALLLGALLALAGLRPAPATSQADASQACSTPDHRSFDFWIGTWEVYGPDGSRVGRNEIRSVMNGCVLHESYDGQQGFHGESFNTWDAGRRVWHQSWVDNSGTLLLLEGGLRDGRMELEGTTVRPDGTPVLNRIVWSVLDDDGDRVRQHWTASTDGGATWTTVFDGEYRKQETPGS